MFPKFNHCKSCGMPMVTPRDFGGEDENNDWCKYCCNKDGSHKSYKEILENMTNFMLSEEGEQMSEIKFNSKEEANKAAKEYLIKMPAWKDIQKQN